MKLTLRSQLLLIALVTLVVYYPVISAGYNPVDDLKMLSTWMERDWDDLWGYFFRKGGYHYRPLVGVTFFFDNQFWALEPSFMHLENILLHLASGLLLYMIVRRIFKICAWEPSYYPFCAALLFLLHPINTEAVSWISGRFDLMAGFLVLCSCFVLLSGETAGKFLSVSISAVLFFLACLAKESAIFWYGGAVLLIFFLKRRGCQNNSQALYASLPGWLVWSGTSILYFIFRHFALSGRDGGIGAVTGTAATAENVVEIFDKVRITCKVMGYYLKKLFIPIPLNYAIMNVHDAYVLLGILLLFSVIFMLWRIWCANELIAVSFLAATGMTLAGLIVALGNMAWTPLAERYLYMPSIFFVIGIVLFTRHYLSRIFSISCYRPIICLLLIVIALVTFQRSLVWSDPIRFLEDTISKSPEFIPARTDLAYLYSRKGQVDKARQLLDGIDADLGENPYANADINRANILIEEGQFAEARDILKKRLENPGKKFQDVANALILVNLKYLSNISDKAFQRELKNENLTLLQRMNEAAGGPFVNYRLGKAYLALEKTEAACISFQKAYQWAPLDAHYREPAGKLVEKLCKN